MDDTTHPDGAPVPPRAPHLRRRAARGLAVAAVTTALTLSLLAACSPGSSEDAASGESAGGSSLSAPEPAGARGAGQDAAALVDPESAADSGADSGADSAADPASPAREQAIIATGTVSLRAGDVGDARFAVQRVVDEHRGEVADEETGTDRDGRVRRSRVVLRVPVAEFDAVMTDLSGIAELGNATRSADDVTTQVIDTEVRVRAQRASLERIEVLLSRAEDLEDIVAIESQLTRRQAELDSLTQQQAYLADQTSQATVTVLIERTRTPRPAEPDEAGFLVGLSEGWGALRGSTVAVLTAVGAVLPFAVLLLLVAGPILVLARRRRPAYAAGLSPAGTAARSGSAPPADPGPSRG